MNYFYFSVSFGTIMMSWDSDELLHRIEWSTEPFVASDSVQLPAAFVDLVDSICRYFNEGDPIGPISWNRINQTGWSDFQKEVYQALVFIPHGQTRTYGWVAAKLGKSSASRAVGQALKKNPLPILIPCHRIQSCRSMGGFMGTADPARPEVRLKRKLIELEKEYESPLFSFLKCEAGGGVFEFMQTF